MIKSDNLTTVCAGHETITFDPSEVSGWARNDSTLEVTIFLRGGGTWTGHCCPSRSDSRNRFGNIVALLKEVLG